MTQTIASELAKYVASLEYESLPVDVVLKAKQCILDQFGAEIACATLPWSESVYKYVKSQCCRGKSTIVTYGLKTSAEYAALANGFFGQAFEIDDATSKLLSGHVGCSTIPVALAVGESQGITGKEFLLSVVLGYQITTAIAHGVQPTMILERAFHPNSAIGPFASAAMAGRILGLDEEKMVNAFSIAGSQSSGLMEYTRGGGDVKRLYGGLGAMSGIRAAYLAKEGLSAPATVFEGEKGFCKTFSNKPAADAIIPALRGEYWILHALFKPYCCNATIIPSIDALTNTLRENPIPLADISEILIGTQALALMAVAHMGPRVKSPVEAQFSMHYSLALTAVKGKNDFRTYMETDYSDPKLIEVAEKVKLYSDEESERELLAGKFLSRVTVKTKYGKSYENKVYAKGTVENPLNRAELEDKFRGLATVALKNEQVEEIIEHINNLEKLDDISRLVRLLVRQNV